jgi:hypothetical protein
MTESKRRTAERRSSRMGEVDAVTLTRSGICLRSAGNGENESIHYDCGKTKWVANEQRTRVIVARMQGLASGWYLGNSQRCESHNNKRLNTTTNLMTTTATSAPICRWLLPVLLRSVRTTLLRR